MTGKQVLYVSGSLGLGHITRDLAIAKELRKLRPSVEVSWLAAHPASMLIKEAGERLHAEASMYADDNVPAEDAAEEGFRLDLLKYLTKAMDEWERNVQAFEQVVNKEQFDLVVADEAYEIGVALADKRIHLEVPFVMLYDFIGNNSMTWSPVEKLGMYMWNREWAKIGDFYDGKKNTALFIGELEDVPDTGLGPFLPNRRDLARKVCEFVGYVLRFDPAVYADKAEVRRQLGYGEEPLVVCSIGGTSVGKDLLTLCGQAYPIIREEIADLRMLMVCGPRLASESLDVPQGVDVKGYVPELHEHFAASDLAIVHAGGTATLELTALRRPFLYFPLEGHFEQQVHVAGRLARHQAGVKMFYSQTTPESLAEKVIASLDKKVTYPPIATDGAERAAQLMSQIL